MKFRAKQVVATAAGLVLALSAFGLQVRAQESSSGAKPEIARRSSNAYSSKAIIGDAGVKTTRWVRSI